MRGEFVGLYLSACAEMYASTGDERVKEKTDRIVAGLAECQAKFGNGFVLALPDSFTIRGEAPLGLWYQTHKLLAGLLDVHQHCGNRQAREAARSSPIGSCGAEKFGYAYLQKTLGVEHGGINEALANLYARTGEKKYLTLARWFNHMAVIGPAMRGEDRLDGLHANTQIPKFIGTAREYELTGDEALAAASRFFWESVVNERSYVTGGNSDGEHFTPKAKLSQALSAATCETCNTYNMLKLTRRLFLWDPKAEYADYYERALYNHILSSQNPQTGMMVYMCPVGPGSRKEYCTPEDSFWCCTGTGIENHAKYGDSIYFHRGRTALFVNLFIASELNWEACGLKLRQRNPLSRGRQDAACLFLRATGELQRAHSSPQLGDSRLRSAAERRNAVDSEPAGKLRRPDAKLEDGRHDRRFLAFQPAHGGFSRQPEAIGFPARSLGAVRGNPLRPEQVRRAVSGRGGRKRRALLRPAGRARQALLFHRAGDRLAPAGGEDGRGSRLGAVLPLPWRAAIRDLLERFDSRGGGGGNVSREANSLNNLS